MLVFDRLSCDTDSTINLYHLHSAYDLLRHTIKQLDLLMFNYRRR